MHSLVRPTESPWPDHTCSHNILRSIRLSFHLTWRWLWNIAVRCSLEVQRFDNLVTSNQHHITNNSYWQYYFNNTLFRTVGSKYGSRDSQGSLRGRGSPAKKGRLFFSCTSIKKSHTDRVHHYFRHWLIRNSAIKHLKNKNVIRCGIVEQSLIMSEVQLLFLTWKRTTANRNHQLNYFLNNTWIKIQNLGKPPEAILRSH